MAIRTNATAMGQRFASPSPPLHILSIIWNVIVLLITLCRSALSLVLDPIVSRIHIKLVIKCEIEIGCPRPHDKRPCDRSTNDVGDTPQVDAQEGHEPGDEEEGNAVGLGEGVGADTGNAGALLGSLFGILGN